jgi:hypothetical protein
MESALRPSDRLIVRSARSISRRISDTPKRSLIPVSGPSRIYWAYYMEKKRSSAQNRMQHEVYQFEWLLDGISGIERDTWFGTRGSEVQILSPRPIVSNNLSVLRQPQIRPVPRQNLVHSYND